MTIVSISSNNNIKNIILVILTIYVSIKDVYQKLKEHPFTLYKEINTRNDIFFVIVIFVLELLTVFYFKKDEFFAFFLIFFGIILFQVFITYIISSFLNRKIEKRIEKIEMTNEKFLELKSIIRNNLKDIEHQDDIENQDYYRLKLDLKSTFNYYALKEMKEKIYKSKI
ncbi:hypothetical protein [Apilactobacillus xinyiensis]|uniref:hypothetical protein n=1 Tax=Apilactobacillus xinyiensis TaxID=2841032 RepID=UPI00336507E9